jgi:hypothetical protein
MNYLIIQLYIPVYREAYLCFPHRRPYVRLETFAANKFRPTKFFSGAFIIKVPGAQMMETEDIS